MRAIGAPDIFGNAGPVRDLRACVRIGGGVIEAAVPRIAVEVLQLRGQLADDAGFAFGGQIRQRQVRPDMGLPVTHRTT